MVENRSKVERMGRCKSQYSVAAPASVCRHGRQVTVTQHAARMTDESTVSNVGHSIHSSPREVPEAFECPGVTRICARAAGPHLEL